jgi:S-(hydroxymethyl)glutathione synthase
MTKPKLHPALDNGIAAASPNFTGGTLVCACKDKPVRVRVEGQIAHNQACGCTKCWKPEGATFSVVAVAPHDKVTVLENGDKLAVVDHNALIQRHACKACGVHMYGPVTREHHFQGLDFIYPERFEEKGWARPSFAAFVSSVIEAGAERFGAMAYDIEGVFWSHRDELCTFDVLIQEFGLSIPALERLALIVRGADTSRLDLAPEAAGLLAASLGLSRMYSDDLEQLEAGINLYDAFYRWARDATAETHNWPVPLKAVSPA